MRINMQKQIALGSGDFIEVYTFRCSPTCNLHTYIFLLPRETQVTNKQKLFRANTLEAGLHLKVYTSIKSPLPEERI
ncbi:MAG: hypothetical protein COB07_10385 [Sulfurovum sp.]|nr:MAG: hypothetical protein COB07_10385 [Sulfurovum sp.]